MQASAIPQLIHVFCSAFGAKALPVQPLFKTLQPLFESKDSKVRDLAKQIVVSTSDPGSLMRHTHPAFCLLISASSSAHAQQHH
jgi:hypothetical protein